MIAKKKSPPRPEALADTMRSLLEECGRERCRLAMALAEAKAENDAMRQLFQPALYHLEVAETSYRIAGDEDNRVEVAKLCARIAALGGDRMKAKANAGNG